MRLRRFARADLRPGQIPLENFLAVAECADRAALHNGNLVRCSEDPYPVGDDDHRRIGRFHSFDGFEEHPLAEVVQAGVGSSRTTRCGSPKNARARPRCWRNPRERLDPPPTTTVSYAC